MGFLSRALESRASKIPGVAVGSENSWLRGIFNFNDSSSGIPIDEFNALNLTAVFACVRILAESVASLPLPVYENLPSGGKDRAIDHYLYPVLHDQPNPEMSSFEWREVMMGHVLLWGNAYSEIVRDGAGRVAQLWPLRPDRMFIWRDPQTHELQYVYSVHSSFDLTADPRKVILRPDQVLHIRGMGYDGVRGYSPVTLNKEAIGLGLATQEYGARFFGQGARPSGVLTTTKPIPSEAKRQLREDWQQTYGGLSNAQRVAVLEDGMAWQSIGIPPEEAQFLATRTFQLNEIARMFRVPPHLLQELTRSTNNNIEHQGLDYVTHTIRPWTVRWEQAFQRSLFQPAERNTYFAEFLLDGLLRGDMGSRYAAYAVGRQWGWLSANEIRNKENMNPIDPEDGDGNGYIVPLNMVAEVPGALEAVPDPQDPSNDPTLGDPAGGSDAGRSILAAFSADVLQRVARRERQDITRAAQKQLTQGSTDRFQAWILAFAKDHRDFVAAQMAPVFKAAGLEAGAAMKYADQRIGELLPQLASLNTEAAVTAFLDVWEASERSVDLGDATPSPHFVIHNHNNITLPQSVVNVPERSIEVRNDFTVPEQLAPVVNVEVAAAEVRVPEARAQEPPVVHVHVPEQSAPNVTVNNEINVPKNKGHVFKLPDGRTVESEPKE